MLEDPDCPRPPPSLAACWICRRDGKQGCLVGGLARTVLHRQRPFGWQRDYSRGHQRNREPHGMSIGTVYGVGLGRGC